MVVLIGLFYSNPQIDPTNRRNDIHSCGTQHAVIVEMFDQYLRFLFQQYTCVLEYAVRVTGNMCQVSSKVMNCSIYREQQQDVHPSLAHVCRYQNSEQADNIPVCTQCAKPLAESLADPVGLTKTLVGAPTGDAGHLSTAAVRTAILLFNCQSPRTMHCDERFYFGGVVFALSLPTICPWSERKVYSFGIICSSLQAHLCNHVVGKRHLFFGVQFCSIGALNIVANEHNC